VMRIKNEKKKKIDLPHPPKILETPGHFLK
jgi:hypothetical protein